MKNRGICTVAEEEFTNRAKRAGLGLHGTDRWVTCPSSSEEQLGNEHYLKVVVCQLKHSANDGLPPDPCTSLIVQLFRLVQVKGVSCGDPSAEIADLSKLFKSDIEGM